MHLAPYLQPESDLGGRQFTMEEDLQSTVAKFFTKHDTEWYNAGGINKLISRTLSALMSRVIM